MSKVSTLAPADTLSLMVQSTDTETHKIDAPTLKPFSKVQVEDKFKEVCLFFWKNVSNSQLNIDGFEKERFI